VRASVAGPMIGLAAMVVGCGSPQPATAPPTPRDELASVAFEDPQAQTFAAARAQLVRRCMAQRGFTLPTAAPAPSVPTADTPPSGAGYGLFAQFAKARPRADATEPGFRRALLGSPRRTGTLHLPDGAVVTYRTSGCYAHAMATLYGSARRYQWLVFTRNVVRGTAGERLARDPRLAGALTGWTRCMRMRGFPYPSPEAARQDVYDTYTKDFDRARAQRRELAIAAADRYCAERTQIYPELARAQHDAIRRMSSDERSAAVAIASLRATALERARRIVTSPG
jgi:hypothetical protein